MKDYFCRLMCKYMCRAQKRYMQVCNSTGLSHTRSHSIQTCGCLINIVFFSPLQPAPSPTPTPDVASSPISSQPNTIPCSTLFVANLELQHTEEEISQLFSRYIVCGSPGQNSNIIPPRILSTSLSLTCYSQRFMAVNEPSPKANFRTSDLPIFR